MNLAEEQTKDQSDHYPGKSLEGEVAFDRLGGSIGAVIADQVDLGDKATVAEVRELVTAHRVVFLKHQNLSETKFVQFAQNFGELASHPLDSLLSRDTTVSVINDTEKAPPAAFPWHTDLSWLASPPRFGFLQALEIPSHGGDTMWVSMTSAYQLLSDSLKDFCRGLTVTHSIDASLAATVSRNHGEEIAEKFQRLHPPVVHPLVRSHPDTGEPSLWLSPMYTQRIVELSEKESSLLLDHLETLIAEHNISIRWNWEVGDLAIWDESCTVHKALADHYPLRRSMRRCNTEGNAVGRYFGEQMQSN